MVKISIRMKPGETITLGEALRRAKQSKVSSSSSSSRSTSFSRSSSSRRTYSRSSSSSSKIKNTFEQSTFFIEHAGFSTSAEYKVENGKTRVTVKLPTGGYRILSTSRNVSKEEAKKWALEKLREAVEELSKKQKSISSNVSSRSSSSVSSTTKSSPNRSDSSRSSSTISGKLFVEYGGFTADVKYRSSPSSSVVEVKLPDGRTRILNASRKYTESMAREWALSVLREYYEKNKVQVKEDKFGTKVIYRDESGKQRIIYTTPDKVKDTINKVLREEQQKKEYVSKLTQAINKVAPNALVTGSSALDLAKKLSQQVGAEVKDAYISGNLMYMTVTKDNAFYKFKVPVVKVGNKYALDPTFKGATPYMQGPSTMKIHLTQDNPSRVEVTWSFPETKMPERQEHYALIDTGTQSRIVKAGSKEELQKKINQVYQEVINKERMNIEKDLMSFRASAPGLYELALTERGISPLAPAEERARAVDDFLKKHSYYQTPVDKEFLKQIDAQDKFRQKVAQKKEELRQTFQKSGKPIPDEKTLEEMATITTLGENVIKDISQKVKKTTPLVLKAVNPKAHVNDLAFAFGRNLKELTVESAKSAWKVSKTFYGEIVPKAAGVTFFSVLGKEEKVNELSEDIINAARKAAGKNNEDIARAINFGVDLMSMGIGGWVEKKALMKALPKGVQLTKGSKAALEASLILRHAGGVATEDLGGAFFGAVGEKYGGKVGAAVGTVAGALVTGGLYWHFSKLPEYVIGGPTTKVKTNEVTGAPRGSPLSVTTWSTKATKYKPEKSLVKITPSGPAKIEFTPKSQTLVSTLADKTKRIDVTPVVKSFNDGRALMVEVGRRTVVQPLEIKMAGLTLKGEFKSVSKNALRLTKLGGRGLDVVTLSRKNKAVVYSKGDWSQYNGPVLGTTKGTYEAVDLVADLGDDYVGAVGVTKIQSGVKTQYVGSKTLMKKGKLVDNVLQENIYWKKEGPKSFSYTLEQNAYVVSKRSDDWLAYRKQVTKSLSLSTVPESATDSFLRQTLVRKLGREHFTVFFEPKRPGKLIDIVEGTIDLTRVKKPLKLVAPSTVDDIVGLGSDVVSKGVMRARVQSKYIRLGGSKQLARATDLVLDTTKTLKSVEPSLLTKTLTTVSKGTKSMVKPVVKSGSTALTIVSGATKVFSTGSSSLVKGISLVKQKKVQISWLKDMQKQKIRSIYKVKFRPKLFSEERLKQPQIVSIGVLSVQRPSLKTKTVYVHKGGELVIPRKIIVVPDLDLKVEPVTSTPPQTDQAVSPITTTDTSLTSVEISPTPITPIRPVVEPFIKPPIIPEVSGGKVEVETKPISVFVPSPKEKKTEIKSVKGKGFRVKSGGYAEAVTAEGVVVKGELARAAQEFYKKFGFVRNPTLSELKALAFSSKKSKKGGRRGKKRKTTKKTRNNR